VVRAFLVATGLLAAFMTILTVLSTRSFRRIARSRAGQGFPEFAASFEGSSVPEEIQRAVFAAIKKNWVYSMRDFPARADDPLDLYPLDVDDLEKTINELAQAFGKEKPMLNVWKGQPLQTVGDIARLIAHLPTPEEVRVEGIRRLWTDAD
jgi:hypothetical protein